MNILDVLRDHRIQFDISGRNKSRTGWVNVKCVDCQRDPYLGINIDTLGCACWNCGPKRIADVLAKLTGMSQSEAITISRGLPRTETITRKERGKLVLPNDLGPLQSPHKRYLANRGFDPDQLVQLWDIRGVGRLGGKLAWFVWIPVYVDGEIVTWTSRRITDQEPRYAAAKPEQSSQPIDSVLYGIDYCRSSILCVEGPLDVLALGPGSVCAFGLRYSARQKETISGFPLRCFLFDSGAEETAAQRRAKQLCDQLSVLPGTTKRIILESGNDPASCSEEEREEIRKMFLK